MTGQVLNFHTSRLAEVHCLCPGERWQALLDSVYELIESTRPQQQIQLICTEAAACLGIDHIALIKKQVVSCTHRPALETESLEFLDIDNGVVAQHPTAWWQVMATQSGPLSQNQLFLFQQFCEHLFQSIWIVQQLRSHQEQINQLYQVLEQVPCPVALFTFADGIYFTNQSFTNFIDSDDQFEFRDGCLLWSQQPLVPPVSAIEPQLDQNHSTYVDQVRLEIHPCQPMLEQDLIAPHYFVMLHSCCMPAKQLATVPNHWLDLLNKQFGLSRKEAILVFHLAQGWSVGQFAKHTFRSKQTVRTQLKTVYKKLSLSSQKALSHWFSGQNIQWQLAQIASLIKQDPNLAWY